MKLTEPERTRINEAVQHAESHTSAEIVVVIRGRSGSYDDVTLVGAVLAGLFGLWAVLFLDWEIDPLEVVPAVLIAGILGGLAARLIGPRLVSSSRRKEQVDDAALASFARCGVHRTTGRTGVLIYVSSSERLSRVLPDQGVIDAVPAAVRAEWRAKWAGVAANAETVAKLVEDMGERAGKFLPRAADDVDELQSQPSQISAVELS